MNSATTPIECDQHTSALKVFILYEDTHTGLRAKRSLDLLPLPFTIPPRPHLQLWRCDLLGDPYLKERLAFEAASADIFLLSFHRSDELPLGVRHCLCRWAIQKTQRPCALCLLLDREPPTHPASSPVLTFLQSIAAEAGADLFYGFSESPTHAVFPETLGAFLTTISTSSLNISNP